MTDRTCGICGRTLHPSAEICPGCGVRVDRRGATPPDISERSGAAAVLGLTGVAMLGYSALNSTVSFGIGYLPDLVQLPIVLACAIVTLCYVGGFVRGLVVAGYFLALGIGGVVEWCSIFVTTDWGRYDSFLAWILAGIAPLVFIAASVAARHGVGRAEDERYWLAQTWR